MNRLYCLIFLMLIFAGCRKAYNPPAIAIKNNVLVIEGQINTGHDSTIITLSRTVQLSAKSTVNPEAGATVTVEDDQNNSYSLTEQGNGLYASADLDIAAGAKQCRLRVKTNRGQTYLSDLVEIKVSPAIDTVGFTVQTNGVQIYLSTHDVTNKSRYYRWDYRSTWIFHSYYESYYKLVNGFPEYRFANEDVYYCWGADTSSTMILNSSAKLAQDVINQTNLAFLPSTSEKLEDRYSILVKQYAITPEAFDYFQILKKNTEQLGSVFDAQPSQLTSNIKCISTPTEPVIGYITAGTVTQKRIYIDSRNLPAWKPYTFYDKYGCALDTVSVTTPNERAYYYNGNPPNYLPLTIPIQASERICVDCTLRGTKTQPIFWKIGD